MARRFKQLTKADRLKIEALDKAGRKVKEIAEQIGVHQSTIYRELKRGRYIHTNSDLTEEERYSPDIAHEKYQENLRAKGPDLKIGNDQSLADFIEDKMVNDDFSVGAVLGYIEQQGLEFSVTITRQTLYRYIDLGLFLNLTNKDLPIKGNRKKKKKTVRKTQARAAAGDSIEKRPEEIDTREEFGHWEMDTVIGKKGESKHSLLVLTERKTREELMFLLMEHTTEQVVSCINRLKNSGAKNSTGYLKQSPWITERNSATAMDCKRASCRTEKTEPRYITATHTQATSGAATRTRTNWYAGKYRREQTSMIAQRTTSKRWKTG